MGGLGLHNKAYRLQFIRGICSRTYAPGPDNEEEEEGGWMFSKNRMGYKWCKDFDGEILMERKIYLPSLMMKVPDHLHVLGDTYTCHT
jgi:hypothetical protein